MRRSITWPRGGLHVRGRKKRAKLCLAKNSNNAMKPSLQKKLRDLQKSVPGSQGIMDTNTLFQSIEKYILLLEAKVMILRCVSDLYGV
ncbi:hypothetical protein RIF29_07466 [Crotalaria pallida]|uniref:Uncharacterized protein n=1 Tax=Crotalaria pallida TaxID=3830 RepID=A0AAN9J452_CROPI